MFADMAIQSDTVQIVAAVCTLMGLMCTAFVGLIGAGFTGYMSYLVAKLNTNQRAAAVKVAEVAEKAEQVKATLSEVSAATTAKLSQVADKVEEAKTLLAETSTAKMEKLGETLKEIKNVHRLVNGNMHLVLVSAAQLADRVAALTGRPEDIEAADQAAQALRQHDATQVAEKASEQKPTP